MNAAARAIASSLVFTLVGCSRGPSPQDPPPEAPASPQAKAVPAQLANIPAIAPSGAIPASLDAGPPPAVLRGDRGSVADVLPARDLVGWSMQAVLRFADLPPPPSQREVSQAGVEAARKKTEPRMAIDLSATRARIVLAKGFLVAPETELRARVDRYGFFVISPGGNGGPCDDLHPCDPARVPTYRTAAPGSLRALLGERRMDVAPLSPADLAPRGEGPRRLGYRTRKVEIVTRAANATIEIARLPDAGDGGTLVCRALLDLINAPPSSTLCAWEEVPLHAELRWTTQGSLVFDVVSVVHRTELSPQQLAAPPLSAVFISGAPPAPPGEALLTNAELTALHSAPGEVPLADGGAADPTLGLVLANTTDETRVAWIEGVPAAWVAPGARLALPTLLKGKYQVMWRTFLGDAIDAPEIVAVPGVSRVGP